MTTTHEAAIGFGDVGTYQTLDLMAGLVDRGVTSPVVVDFARRLAVSAGVRNAEGQALKVRSFLKRAWRFVDDPNTATHGELLSDPEKLLRDYDRLGFIPGDCDEAAILGAALGAAVGLRAWFTVLAFNEAGEFEHVFASLLTPGGVEVSLDVTKPSGPVPRVTRSLTVAL